MEEINKQNPADDIVRRAYKLNISISEVCKYAGVSRRWFEYFKQRTPQSVEAYLKILEYLDTMERGNKSNTTT